MEVKQFRIRLSAPNQVEVEAEHGKNKGPAGPQRRGGSLCSYITMICLIYINMGEELMNTNMGDGKYPGR